MKDRYDVPQNDPPDPRPPSGLITGSGVPRPKVGIQYDGEDLIDYPTLAAQEAHEHLLHLLDVALRAGRALEKIKESAEVATNPWSDTSESYIEDWIVDPISDVIKLLRSPRR